MSPQGEIFNFNPGWKKLVSHLSFNPGQNEYFFYFISTQGENIFAKICGIFYKKDVSHAVTGLYKNNDVRFHQQEK